MCSFTSLVLSGISCTLSLGYEGKQQLPVQYEERREKHVMRKFVPLTCKACTKLRQKSLSVLQHKPSFATSQARRQSPAPGTRTLSWDLYSDDGRMSVAKYGVRNKL